MITTKVVTTNRKQTSTTSHVEDIDWTKTATDLDAQGYGIIKGLLLVQECLALVALYPETITSVRPRPVPIPPTSRSRCRWCCAWKV